MSDSYIPEDEWETIVSNVPIVSVDLVVLYDGGVVLGKRTNQPAKGEWFVPGGRVHKHERLREAVHRIAQKELNVEVEIQESLGSYEHFYEVSDVDGSDGKHYVAHGFVVTPTRDVGLGRDDQHADVRVFEFSELPSDLHEYPKSYLEDAEVLDSTIQ
ncbi:NUDIX domain-containing protein [Salarchaeum sp. III]|uniref:GDP-mannose mannosyl hydrolase n=1 Tax=Salarchaeum sp. III TaxID=3107927 RepID=UPI002ED87AE3